MVLCRKIKYLVQIGFERKWTMLRVIYRSGNVEVFVGGLDGLTETNAQGSFWRNGNRRRQK